MVDDSTRAYPHNSFGLVSEIDGTGSHFCFTHLRARDFNPAQGRFLSVDTVQPNAPGTQGFNVYAYVANNPTTWVYPTGHQAANPAAPNLRPMPEVRAIAGLLAYMALARAGVVTVATTCVAYIVICSLALLAVAIVVVLFVVICVLEVGGPCWTTEILERPRETPKVEDLPHGWPKVRPQPRKDPPAPIPMDKGGEDRCRAAANTWYVTNSRRDTHILRRHGPNAVPNQKPGNGIFHYEWYGTPGIEMMIGVALSIGSVHIDRGRCVFEHTFGYQIGVSSTHQPTNTIRVLMEYTPRPGYVVTAYPI